MRVGERHARGLLDFTKKPILRGQTSPELLPVPVYALNHQLSSPKPIF